MKFSSSTRADVQLTTSMRMLSLLIACSFILMLAACKSTDSVREAASKPVPTFFHAGPDGVYRISVPDLKHQLDLDASKVVIVDTRAAVQYQQSHVKGAINIPQELFVEAGKTLPRDKLIVAYCS